MEELARRFADDGYAFPFQVLDAAEAASYAAGHDGFQAQARTLLGSEQRFKAHLLVGWMDRIVHRHFCRSSAAVW